MGATIIVLQKVTHRVCSLNYVLQSFSNHSTLVFPSPPEEYHSLAAIRINMQDNCEKRTMFCSVRENFLWLWPPFFYVEGTRS